MKFSHYTANFKHLILGRSVRNIADSFYLVALSLGLVAVYHIDAANLSLFTLVGMLPNLFSFLYGTYLHQLKKDKAWLLTFQTAQLFIMLSIIATFYFHGSIYLMYGLNFLFSLTTSLLNTIQMKVIPATLDNNDELINASIDIQYVASNVIDIISNFIASVLLTFLSYLLLMDLSIPFFIGAIYFMFRLKIKDAYFANENEDDDEAEEQRIRTKQSLQEFFSEKRASFIICTEAVLSGGTDLLLTLAPLYLLAEKIPLTYLGIVIATRRAADLLGAMVAPKIKMNPYHFFSVDYMISGLALLLIFILPQPLLKLVCLFVAFFVIGISGNIFEKMVYEAYDHSKMALVFSVISSLYTAFGIIFLLVPTVYDNITVLGIVINVATIFVGIWLWIRNQVTKKR